MKKWLPYLGVFFLLAVFAVSAFRIVTRGVAAVANPDGEVVIRFAHWNLEGGLREAYDEIIRDYMALHPGVRVEQLAVPERVYKMWVTTRLVGDTAPDLIQYQTTASDKLARYFTPLSPWMDAPNPYNAGTELEGMRWRDTFIDGLTNPHSFNEELLDVYGIALATSTIRLYYNKELYRRLFADEPPPETLPGFLALCERAKERGVLPLAGSRYNGPILTQRYFHQQTQSLALEDSPRDTLSFTYPEMALKLLSGEWDFARPPLRGGLEVMQRLSACMQPGFTQLAREDATFQFAQGRALMIATGSWDYGSLRQEAPFELGVLRPPMEDGGRSAFAGGALGPISETDSTMSGVFGLTANSRHPKQVIDFLHYLTSQPVNTRFAARSGWIPAIVGTKVQPEQIPFLPVTEGYPRSFRVFGADTLPLLFTKHIGLLSNPGGLEPYLVELKRELPASLRGDLMRNLKVRTQNIQRQDGTLAALRALERRDDDATPTALALRTESQFAEQASIAWTRHHLATLGEENP